MSITNHNGALTITTFAELGSVLDPDSLSSQAQAATNRPSEIAQHNSEHSAQLVDLASVLAQLATMSTGLDTMSRQDSQARDRAALELARYDALLADREEAQRALADARRFRAAAERLAAEAFTEEARAYAAQQAASARALELSSAELLSQRTRALEELAALPHLARALADRHRVAEQQTEAARRAEVERDERLASGVSAVRQALAADELERAQQLLEPMLREFPDNRDVQAAANCAAWRVRHRLVGPAQEALREIVRRSYRQDPEAAVARLAALSMDNLPEELGRRAFGLWSNACYLLVQQRGWHNPKRYARATSRGIAFASPTPEAPQTVVSSLGLPDWRPGDIVVDRWVLKAARPLQPPRSATSQ